MLTSPQRQCWELFDDHNNLWAHSSRGVLVAWVNRVNSQRATPAPPLFARIPQRRAYDARKKWAGAENPRWLGRVGQVSAVEPLISP